MDILIKSQKKGTSPAAVTPVYALFFSEEDCQRGKKSLKTLQSFFQIFAGPASVKEGISKWFLKVFEERIFKGAGGERLFVPVAAEGSPHLILVGLGKREEMDYETVRKALAVAVRGLSAHEQGAASFILDGLAGKATSNWRQLVWAASEGAVLAGFCCDQFKNAKDKKKPLKKLVFVVEAKHKKAAEAGLKTGQILGECTNITKTLASSPGNFMTPAILADRALEYTKGTKIKTAVWTKERIKKERMGGLLGVSRGSAEEPRFIVMEYKGGGKKSAKPICLVGKGVTFDSGGISLKPGAKMDEMKFDMCGAAAVIGAMLAIEKLKLKVHVMGLVAATENMPDALALKPGDIIKARNGKTMEILNTDAEGRLILADALSYASEQKPQAIFDAATLTGAMFYSLGSLFTGFFTQDKHLSKKITAAGEVSGERLWPMPLVKEHTEDMKSEIADIANISTGQGGAGSSTAAAFLKFFVDKNIPYAHFDIAGTAWNVNHRLAYCAPKMASGVMVRTFVELARSFE